MNTPRVIRLGARGSLLSRMQSEGVARALEAAAAAGGDFCRIELVTISTSGDRIQDRPLHEFGGKGLFTKELELALLRGEVDFVVHSFKDVPVTMPLVDTAELVIAATPVRADPRDVLICSAGRNVQELSDRARVGTGSLRRQAQLLALRPDLQVVPIRGNIDTRLRKLREGQYDAIILAFAGLARANLFDPALMTPIDTGFMLPAAGQGALALQCRRDATDIRARLEWLNDPHTALAVSLEREVVRLLEGDCHSPIAVLATIKETEFVLSAAIAARNGRPPVITNHTFHSHADSKRAAAGMVEALVARGAKGLLHVGGGGVA